MTVEKILHALIASSLVLAQTVKVKAPPAEVKSPAPVSSAEKESYHCAQSVASLIHSENQLGPLFAQGDLVFTSLQAADGSRLLLADAGAGIYSVRLDSEGVNRIRFQIPTAKSETPVTFFLSYAHSEAMRSRFFEFGESRPPLGRGELDFVLVTAHRDQALQPHLDYSIHETAESALSAMTEGRLTRAQLSPHAVQGCEEILKQGDALAQNLRYNLDQLDLLINGPGGEEVATSAAPAGRAPASEFGAPARVVAIPSSAGLAGVKN